MGLAIEEGRGKRLPAPHSFQAGFSLFGTISSVGLRRDEAAFSPASVWRYRSAIALRAGSSWYSITMMARRAAIAGGSRRFAT